MKFSFEHRGQRFAAESRDGISIGVPLQFDGPQANHFGTDPATRVPLRLGDFVGDTENGGSCNVDSLNLIPHCNGTHTETISHIVNEDIWVGHAAAEIIGVALLVSVPITLASQSNETYRPKLDPSDLLITAKNLSKALGDNASGVDAIVIRTLPNETQKRSRHWAQGIPPAFLTIEAIDCIVDLDLRHLLIDLPSIDRMYDDGLLTNHHRYWNVPEKTHRLTAESWQDKTITEMVFVPDELDDGLYLLNLQIPNFATDAAPSRPILIPLHNE